MKSTVLKTIICLMLLSFGETAFSQNDNVSQRKIALKLLSVNPDSSLILFERCKKGFLTAGDTINAIKCLVESANKYVSMAQYGKAYDGFWEALILSKESRDSSIVGQLYDGIGLLYSLFDRNSDAENYYQRAIQLKKKLIALKIIDEQMLVNTYFLLTIHSRENGKYQLAQNYLDSCKMIRNRMLPNKQDPYIDCEQSYLYFYTDRYSEAISLLLAAEKLMLQRDKSYMVILYSFLGDVFNATNEPSKSEIYYLMALDYANKYPKHQNLWPAIYEKLAELYKKWHHDSKAFEYLKMAMSLNDSLFDARSNNNSDLLQIKDRFLLVQEKLKMKRKEFHLNKLEQEKRILLYKNIMLIILIIWIVSFLGFSIYVIKDRHKTERKLLESNHSLNEQKNKEVLELKNKELTTSSLQLIEKYELLYEIRDNLVSHIESNNKRGLMNVLKKIQSNNRHDWDTFNARFVAVNDKFYNNLSGMFPELTQHELELCALVKLNFSSKEMSQLLGITVESVHTSRYRLRQKMNLTRGENLSEFIAGI